MQALAVQRSRPAQKGTPDGCALCIGGFVAAATLTLPLSRDCCLYRLAWWAFAIPILSLFRQQDKLLGERRL
jgi:hypothetical protein